MGRTLAPAWQFLHFVKQPTHIFLKYSERAMTSCYYFARIFSRARSKFCRTCGLAANKGYLTKSLVYIIITQIDRYRKITLRPPGRRVHEAAAARTAAPGR